MEGARKASSSQNKDWMFCPYTGALLHLDAVKNVASSQLSGYSISLNGGLESLCQSHVHRVARPPGSSPPPRRRARAHRPSLLRALPAELENRVVVAHETDMADYTRRYGLEPLVKSSEQLEEEDALRGRTRATVDECCPKCGHQGLEFYTLQLRSADEGQTVFYECVECGHKYSQNN
jgi:DNA-directed RNA polymerase I subunit RPA12